MRMASTLMYLVTATVIVCFVSYGVGLILRKRMTKYEDFQYRL
jgi:hypothetical protein